MRKKFTSLLLVLCMVLTMLPITAFAAGPVAITLETEGLVTGSVIPAAETDDEDITLETTWTRTADADGTEVTDAEPVEADGENTFADAGTYTATITVTGDSLDDATFTLNGKTATLEEDSLTIEDVEVATGYTITVEEAQNGTVTTDPADNAAEGAEVTITATPSDGYAVDDITVTDASGASVEVTDDKFEMPASNVTVTVTFKASIEPPATTYTITVAEAQNGTVSTDPADNAAEGTDVTINAEPEEDYVVNTITVTDASGASVEVTDDKFKMPASNVTVTVTFKASTEPPATTYTITVAEAQNGTVSTTPADSAAEGTDVTINAEPEEDYVVNTITVTDASGDSVEVTDDKFKMPASNVTVTVTFREKTDDDLPISIESVAITLVPADGVAVGDTLPEATTTVTHVTISTEWKNEDDVVVTKADTAGNYTAEITVTAKNGYELSETTYTIDGESAVLEETTAVLTKTIKVEAAVETEYDVTVNATPTAGGTVEADKETATTGAQVTVTLSPAEGYKVDVVTLNGTVVPVTGTEYTFTMPEADVTILVTFVKEETVTAEPVVATPEVTGNTAAATVDKDEISKAIEAAQGDDDDASIGIFTIDAKSESTAADAVTVSTVALPTEAVTNLAESAEKVQIQTDVGDIIVPAGALTAILAEAEEAETIVFRCENTSDDSDDTTETFQIGFYPADSSDPEDEFHITNQNITLTLMTSFEPETSVDVSSEGKTLATATKVAANGAVTFTITHLSEVSIEKSAEEAPETMALHIKTENGNDDLYPKGIMKVTITGSELTDLSSYAARIQINDVETKTAQIITVLAGTAEGIVFGVDTQGEHSVVVALYQNGTLASFAQWDVSVGMDETFHVSGQD